MKKLKKIFALVAVITMLASMMAAPVFAESYKYEKEAVILNQLGLMAGYGLGDQVNRVQGIIFALKAAGKEDEVEAMSDAEAARIIAEKVVDANEVPAWGAKWVAYAVKYGYTSGVDASVAPKVKFAPIRSMAATEILVWLMNIGMGYKAGTNTSVSEAVNAGIIRLSQAMEFGPKPALIRDDIAGILYGACKNGVCADGRTFIQSLIDAGFVTEKAAIEAGFVEAKPVELSVVDVKADNLKQLVVEFNMPIKNAGDEENYIIENDDEVDAVIDEDSTFELSKDNMSVTITLTEPAAQQEVIDLTIKGIESESGLKLKETTIEDIEFFDNTPPRALSASVVGQYTIKVVFSEPIRIPEIKSSEDPDDYFTIDDGDYFIEKLEKFNNDTEINITLYSPIYEGTIEVETKPYIKDYAGFSVPRKTFNVRATEDDEAPVVTGYKDAKRTQVTFIFNEDIELLGDPFDSDYLDNFYHTNKNNPASDVEVNGNELTIWFEDSEMPVGRAYVNIEKNALQDLWGNKNAKITYVVDIKRDTTPPVLEKVEQDTEYSIELTFSKKLDDYTAEDIDNYTIRDENGKVIKDIIDDAVLNGNVVTIYFEEEIFGTFSIVVEDIEDLEGNVIARTTKSFTMTDRTAPNSPGNEFEAKIYKAGEKGQLLKVFFKEAMKTSGQYSVLDLEKYEIGSVNLADLDGTTIKITDGGTAVEIRVPSYEDVDDPRDDYLDIDPNDWLYIARVADISGNRTPTNYNRVRISGSTAVEIEKVELTAKDTLVVTLKDRLSKFVSDDFEDAVSATGADVRVTRVRQSVNSAGKTVVTITLRGWDRTTVTGLKFETDNTKSQNAYGDALEERMVTIEDKAPPTVLKVDYQNPTTIVITLSEAIDSGTAADNSRNGFSVNGGELERAEVNGTTITLIGTNFKETTDVSYNSIFGLADDEGNLLASFTRTDKLD